ncbi:MAG: hypothetical protein SAMD01599839_16730 [Rectinema sp.]
MGLLTFDHRKCNRFNPQIIGFIEMISTLVAALNLKPSTLQSKLKKLGIRREWFLSPRGEH